MQIPFSLAEIYFRLSALHIYVMGGLSSLRYMEGGPNLEISSHNLKCLLDNQFRFLIRWAFKGLSQRKHVSMSVTSENITIKNYFSCCNSGSKTKTLHKSRKEKISLAFGFLVLF